MRGTLAHSRQEFVDPERKCKLGLKPAKCLHLRDVLIADARQPDGYR